MFFILITNSQIYHLGSVKYSKGLLVLVAWACDLSTPVRYMWNGHEVCVCMCWLGVGSAVTASAPARRRRGRGQGRRKAKDTSEITPQPAPSKVTCGKTTLPSSLSCLLALSFHFFLETFLLNLSVYTLAHLFIILHSFRFNQPFIMAQFCPVCVNKY